MSQPQHTTSDVLKCFRTHTNNKGKVLDPCNDVSSHAQCEKQGVKRHSEGPPNQLYPRFDSSGREMAYTYTHTHAWRRTRSPNEIENSQQSLRDHVKESTPCCFSPCVLSFDTTYNVIQAALAQEQPYASHYCQPITTPYERP